MSSEKLPPIDDQALYGNAQAVLEANVRGDYVTPAAGMYDNGGPFLWDVAISATAMASYDPQLAAKGLVRILEGQWQNGMVPNMHFGGPKHLQHYKDSFTWASRHLNSDAPRNLPTSSITQPPILANSALIVGQALPADERRDFYGRIINPLVDYHQWIYRDRTFGDGLFAAVHPWETGMENTPVWAEHMRSIQWEGIPGIVKKLGSRVVQKLRNDNDHDRSERASEDQALLFATALVSLRGSKYDANRLREQHPLHIKDVHMTSLLIRNNLALAEIAQATGTPLPDTLIENMARSKANLETMWDDSQQLYTAQDALTGKRLATPTIASLMPLYAGTILPERAEALIAHSQDSSSFASAYGVRSVPKDSPFYRPSQYWSGPVWAHMNGFLYDGATQYDDYEAALNIGRSTLLGVQTGGIREYVSPESGEGLGAVGFSMTAASIMNIINNMRQNRQ